MVGGAAADWRVLGASVPGTGHLKQDVPCQDASGWYQSADCLAIAVADGAGSVSHADRGAAVAVMSVLAALQRVGETCRHRAPDAEDGIRIAFRYARYAVVRAARTAGTEPRALASTLAVAFVTPASAAFGQVGDGIIAVEGPDGIRSLATPAKEGYVNETTFLTGTDASRALRIESVAPGEVSAVALSTDGLSLLVLDGPATGEPYRPFFADTFTFARSDSPSSAAIREFLLTVDDRTGDDKTLVVATAVGV